MNKKQPIAIITGAGTGIGRAVANGLAEDNYKVLLIGRRKEALQETIKLSPNPQNMVVYSCDITDIGASRAFFAHFGENYDHLSLIFNNAGVFAPAKSPDELEYDHWLNVINTNLNAVFLWSQWAFGQMRHQQPMGGRIINNGSISSETPRPFSAPYTASKHAITGLTKALSLDGRQYDICVSQIDIGNAATPMTEKMAVGVLQADGTTKPEARMDCTAVAEAIRYIAKMPLDTNILRMNIMANKMPFVGRG